MSETKEEILNAIETGVIGDVLSTPLSSEDAEALVATAKDDPGAPFESPMLARLAATKRIDLAMFMRLRARLKEAKVSISELDRALARSEATAHGEVDADPTGGQGRPISFRTPDPWPESVDGASMLGEIVTQVQRYVMLPRDAAIAVALWIIHAYCFMLFAISPRLGIISPEKRCGKTTLLRFVQALVPKALAAANITAAAMFRTIEKHRPTLLIDEADTFLRDNEELRGVINSGHERNGGVIRLTGEDFEPTTFSTFCPTAIAAIGSLPGTIEDRAIMVELRRRKPSELIERFRSDRTYDLDGLAQKIRRWTEDHADALRDADPSMPSALHDRACDNFRPLLAIADLVGGRWPEQARTAAVALCAAGNDHDEQSRGVMLLADIRRVFDAGGADPVSSTGLADALISLADRPWAAWMRGKPITPAAIARLLKLFGIAPTTIKQADGKQPNGYRRSQFQDAFERYLCPASGFVEETSPPSPNPAGFGRSGEPESSPAEGSREDLGVAEGREKSGFGEDGELPQLKVRTCAGDAAEDEDDLLVDDLLEQIMQNARRNRAAAADADL